MISTLYFIQFIAFYLWQYTAKQPKRKPLTGPLGKFAADKKLMRITGAVLLMFALIDFIYQWGLLSGICGFVIGLMCVGCLSAVLVPFKYLGLPGIATLYVCCVALEILI